MKLQKQIKNENQRTEAFFSSFLYFTVPQQTTTLGHPECFFCLPILPFIQHLQSSSSSSTSSSSPSPPSSPCKSEYTHQHPIPFRADSDTIYTQAPRCIASDAITVKRDKTTNLHHSEQVLPQRTCPLLHVFSCSCQRCQARVPLQL